MTSAEQFNCILCKESFTNKDDLQIHFRKHGDPKFNESLQTKSRVQTDAAATNEKSNEPPEMVNCDVCSEVFPTISKAITHKHKCHPDHDSKYFCPWCGKLFTMKHLYNKHLHTNHDAVEEVVAKDGDHFHCDSCNVYFFVPSAMVYHNRFFHRQETELPIIGHSKKQKLLSQELLPVYYCSFCGEEYINKVNLHKHMCDDHSHENQRPSDVLRCPLCDAIFYHLDAYELHLTFHSSEDLYSETNEMNITEISEFSLETVPPAMERVEDLNNLLPDEDTNTDAVGIESLLQMDMDEPNDNNQVSKKSKKHKKHKKSKKSAITLDEFLNMNQDVFGEDLDFHGIEEVPTKVIKRQLKPKKAQIQKIGSKLASSADLQKLKKQGIVVKVKSGSTPSLQLKQIGQTVKVSPHLKKITNQASTKAISASNDVLSKLMNQGNNQLKIVKKSALEKTHDDQQIAEESLTEITMKTLKDEVVPNSDDIDPDAYINSETNIKLTVNSKSETAEDTKEDDKLDSQHLNTSELRHQGDCTTAKITETDIETKIATSSKENKTNMTENNSHTKEIENINSHLNSGIIIKGSLKNIGNQITIKPVIICNKLINQEKSITPRFDEEDTKSLHDHETELNTAIGIEKSNNTLDTLKNINSDITIKSLKDKHQTSVSPNIDKHEDLKADCNLDTDLGKSMENDNITLDSFKSINSAITIKSLKNKSVAYANCNDNISKDTEHKVGDVTISKNIPVEIEHKGEKLEELITKTQEVSKEKQIQISSSISSSIVLKNLSKNITIKPMSSFIKQSREDVSNDEGQSNDEFEDDDNQIIEKSVSKTPAFEDLSSRQKINTNLKKPNISSNYSNQQTNKTIKEKVAISGKELPINENNKITNIQSNNDLLKHLKHITAKPVSTLKNTRQQVTASSNTSTNAINGNNLIKKSVKEKVISEEIEIFNIDDSDSDGAVAEQKRSLKLDSETKKLEPSKTVKQSNATINAIKNISKHITIKSSSNQIKQTDNVKTNLQSISDFDYFSDEDEINDDAVSDTFDDFEENPITIPKKATFNQALNQKAEPFKNVLKNLGKHITVKSRNASPSPSLKSLDHGSQDSQINYPSNDDDSDQECSPGKVKITEVTDDNFSDDDIDHTSTCENKGIVTHSPDGSNSGNEHFSDIEESDDYDSHIPRKKIEPSSFELKSNNECLKNISKNITIKALNERSVEKQGMSVINPRTDKEKIGIHKNVSKDLLFKPVNQSETQNESSKFKSPITAFSRNAAASSSSNKSTHLKHAQSQGVVNVNKEVNVKTFQSETVIEEITTTVTKTIRRVNQVNQQVYNANQQPAPRIIQQNNRPRMGNYNQSPKNFQGIQVRQSTPTMSPKIRQAVPCRPRLSSAVRPSNQLVPIRPVRPVNNPRMQVNNMPPQQQKPIGIGKPLKISPTVMNQNLKRPGTEEKPGPFSCFKKPKESLIPTKDTGLESGSNYQYESSSQVNKFCSTTKTVNDNAVLNSRQMKCESTSQQLHVSRNSNVAGLKITKTKQVSEIQRSEMSASKRTTLEAIEKLQKQGLLVKKPRVEEKVCDFDFGSNNESNDDD